MDWQVLWWRSNLLASHWSALNSMRNLIRDLVLPMRIMTWGTCGLGDTSLQLIAISTTITGSDLRSESWWAPWNPSKSQAMTSVYDSFASRWLILDYHAALLITFATAPLSTSKDRRPTKSSHFSVHSSCVMKCTSLNWVKISNTRYYTRRWELMHHGSNLMGEIF